jgi:aspartate racemase
MRKIGIIGGIGWPSTIEYYRLICEASQLYHNDKKFSGPTPMPEIVIESMNMNFTVNNRGSTEPDSWHMWDEYFTAAIHRLENSGAELILLASVTPHARLAEISKDTNIPIISIYESIGAHCNANGIVNLLVLGTMPTMTSPSFKCGMEKFGVNVFHPPTGKLKTGVIDVIEKLYQNKTDGAALTIDELVRSCVPVEELDNTAVCLGCTELPLAFKGLKDNSSFKYRGVNYLNSSVVHALSAFQACVK